MSQVSMEGTRVVGSPLRGQLLKWIGNKQRHAPTIISSFPTSYGRYFEPFLGSGAVLATLAPPRGLGSDTFGPLIQIWQCLKENPAELVSWYAERWNEFKTGEKRESYERIKRRYNDRPNGADLLFLSRSCYGGVVRFRHADGYMSTPCGVHDPISPTSFAERVKSWSERTRRCDFEQLHYTEAMSLARRGDLIYCDPPYRHSQAILYKAQRFNLDHLFKVIADCKDRGVAVALSIDGTKRSGDLVCDVPLPPGLFRREVEINCGRSMLRRFQLKGRDLQGEVVTDRLLLT